MSEMLGRLPSDTIKKKFKRECYKYLSQRELRTIPLDLIIDPISQKLIDLLVFFHPTVKLVEISNPSELLITILNIYFNEEDQ
jgi:hypothetical protein